MSHLSNFCPKYLEAIETNVVNDVSVSKLSVRVGFKSFGNRFVLGYFNVVYFIHKINILK